MHKESAIPYRKTFHSLKYLFLLCLIIPLLTSCENRRTIVNALEEREANEILVFLSTKNIDALKIKSAEGGGGGGQTIVLWDISVLANQSTEAMHILNQQGLPRRKGQSLLGIFADGGLVPSELQEKIKYQSGLSEQIASVIRKIDGVLDASVQISFPEEDPLNPGKKKGEITASVYVKHGGVLDDPNTQLVTKIKRLVGGSVTGLDIDNVTLISDRSRFGDISGLSGIIDREKQYVSIWTIIMAKESVTRFRVIFFTFTLIILTLLLSFIWMGWKVSPLLKKYGGVSALFHLGPIAEEEEMEDKEVEETEDDDEEEYEDDDEDEDDEDEEDTADKTRDVT